MTTFPKLVDALAALDDRDRVTVETYLRRLRESGLIAVGGRGSQTAMMSPSDAASALIGLNVVTRASEAPAAVTRYRAMHGWQSTRAGSEEHLPEEVADADSLGAAIEALIETAPIMLARFSRRALLAYPEQPTEFVRQMVGSPSGCIWLEVDFSSGPVESAAIRVMSNLDRGPMRLLELVYSPAPGVPVLERPEADRRVRTVIGLPTILALHRATTYQPAWSPEPAVGLAARPARMREATAGRQAVGGDPIPPLRAAPGFNMARLDDDA